MYFDYRPEENAFCEAVKKTLSSVEAGKTLNRDFLLSAARVLAKAGYFAPGIDNGHTSDFAPEIARFKGRGLVAGHDPALFLALELGNHLAAQALACWGGAKKRLQDLLAGQVLTVLALVEDNLNFDLSGLQTLAKRQETGFILKGKKRYLPLGAQADQVLVLAKLEEQPAFFMLPTDRSGLHWGEPYSALGFDTLKFSDLTLEGVSAGPDDVVGPVADKHFLDRLFNLINQALIAGAVGLMHRVFALARSFTLKHVNGGKPIIAYQEVGFKLAEMLTILQTAELIGLKSARLAGDQNKEALEIGLTAKVFCGEALEKLSSEALQVMSGAGFFESNPAELAYRCAKFFQIAGSSTEVSRISLGDLCLGYKRW